jgi:hypothetical protein
MFGEPTLGDAILDRIVHNARGGGRPRTPNQNTEMSKCT